MRVFRSAAMARAFRRARSSPFFSTTRGRVKQSGQASTGPRWRIGSLALAFLLSMLRAWHVTATSMCGGLISDGSFRKNLRHC
ncbi:hypothetical protein D3C72_1846860 [compost metagenome]